MTDPLWVKSPAGGRVKSATEIHLKHDIAITVVVVVTVYFAVSPSGAVVPQCDDDGFYKTVQCDSTTGQCWCSDRNGNRVTGTGVDGATCW